MKTLLVPLQIDSRGGLATTDSSARIIKQQILDIVTTANFERCMNPQYGAGVPEMVFSSILTAILTTKAEEVKRRLDMSVNLGRVVSVIITPTPGHIATITVDIKYTVSPSLTVYEVRHTVTGLITDETFGALA